MKIHRCAKFVLKFYRSTSSKKLRTTDLNHSRSFRSRRHTLLANSWLESNSRIHCFFFDKSGRQNHGSKLTRNNVQMIGKPYCLRIRVSFLLWFIWREHNHIRCKQHKAGCAHSYEEQNVWKIVPIYIFSTWLRLWEPVLWAINKVNKNRKLMISELVFLYKHWQNW